MAGCGPTTLLRVKRSGELTATRRTPNGVHAPAFFRAILSLLHRSSPTAGSSLRWDRVLSTAADLHLFMRSVPTARGTSPRAGSSGLLARSVVWRERPLRKTVSCTLGTWAELFIVWMRQPAPPCGSTIRSRLSGDAFSWLATGFTSGTKTAP